MLKPRPAAQRMEAASSPTVPLTRGRLPAYPDPLEPGPSHVPIPYTLAAALSGGAPRDRSSRARVCMQERPDAILPTMGGQTALNLAKALSEVRLEPPPASSPIRLPPQRPSPLMFRTQNLAHGLLGLRQAAQHSDHVSGVSPVHSR